MTADSDFPADASDSTADALPRRPRPPAEQLLARALRLRCPRCGEGRMFTGWFSMLERCDHCGLKYERAPGYFLGSAYINYGVIALLTTFSFLVLHFGFGFSTKQIKYPLFTVAILLPLFTFRYARALWLALDSHFDASVLADETATENDQ
ncbi:MAG: DUF983 domain-containing protein [Planctomycetaceae bacterium]